MSANPTFESPEAAQADDAPGPLSATGPVFVLASAGSGADVLTRVLDTHPALTLLAEPAGPWSSLPAGPGGSDRLTAEHATAEVTESLRRWAAELQGGSTPLLDDPRNSLRVPFLHAVFPEARFIHVVRDGRDVARALMVDLGGEDWSAPKPPGWRELRDRAGGFLRCALAWREVVATTLADLDGLSHTVVRFEDLIERPREAAERVCSALGFGDAEWSREAFARAPAIARELPNAQRYTVRRWRAVAVERPFELRAANVLIGDLLERLGYEAAPPELAQEKPAGLPRSLLLELRRLQRMVEERETRIAKLERELGELQHDHRAERRAAEHARAGLAAAERRAGDEATTRSHELDSLTRRVAELEAAGRVAAELAEAVRARQRELEERLEAAETARAELLRERRELDASLDAASDAMRRAVDSRSWRLGHRLTRLASTLLMRRPGRENALERALDDIERARRGRGA
jgi:hypothetical protein